QPESNQKAGRLGGRAGPLRLALPLLTEVDGARRFRRRSARFMRHRFRAARDRAFEIMRHGVHLAPHAAGLMRLVHRLDAEIVVAVHAAAAHRPALTAAALPPVARLEDDAFGVLDPAPRPSPDAALPPAAALPPVPVTPLDPLAPTE